MLTFAVGALAAADARTATVVAWAGVALSVLILVLGLLIAWSGTVHCSLAVLAALLLLRDQDRLVLAPLYGACLLIVGELAQRSIELRGRAWIGPGVIGSRLAALTLLAALGACAAAVGSVAVRVAPARSVGFTAIGTIAAVAAVAVIVLVARRRVQDNARDDRASPAGKRQTQGDNL